MSRTVPAVHAARPVAPDPDWELGLAEHLRALHDVAGLAEIYERFRCGATDLDGRMRRVVWRAGAARFGHGVTIAPGVRFTHLETFAIGDGVFIGADAQLQGRHDGRCEIGAGSWIGPQAFLDARDLVIGESVGWGPASRLVGSSHTGTPSDRPVIETELTIAPVRIGPWVDVGAGAVVLPGVTIGRAAIVGAGAVVSRDVAPFAVVAGVPARHLRWREGHEPVSGDAADRHPSRSS